LKNVNVSACSKVAGKFHWVALSYAHHAEQFRKSLNFSFEINEPKLSSVVIRQSDRVLAFHQAWKCIALASPMGN
jgi:hypothetical protein